MKIYSSAKTCLRDRGIGFIAGFGDSLGEEQYLNMAALLGLPSAVVTGPKENGLVCHGDNRWKDSREMLHNLTNVRELRGCVQESANMLLAGKSRNVTSTVVLVSNFFVQREMENFFYVDSLAEKFRAQALEHGQLARDLLVRGNINYRRIFFSAIAPQGFRFQGFTPARLRRVNALAREILGGAGWEILDAYNITLPRPDGSIEGLHYAGGVAAAITDVLMTMLCH